MKTEKKFGAGTGVQNFASRLAIYPVRYLVLPVQNTRSSHILTIRDAMEVSASSHDLPSPAVGLYSRSTFKIAA